MIYGYAGISTAKSGEIEYFKMPAIAHKRSSESLSLDSHCWRDAFLDRQASEAFLPAPTSRTFGLTPQGRE